MLFEVWVSNHFELVGKRIINVVQELFVILLKHDGFCD